MCALAASFLEPCSNALIEALASGLPTLYQDGSGHNELVKSGGLAYQTSDQIPYLLEKIVHDYHTYQVSSNPWNGRYEWYLFFRGQGGLGPSFLGAS